MRLPLSAAVASQIREIVEATDALSITEMVAETGIPRPTLYRKLDGHTSFTLDDVVAIADYMGSTPGAIISAAEAQAGAA